MSKSTKQLANGAIETVTIFNDGMTSDVRTSNGFALARNFHHYRDRLQLRRGTERVTDDNGVGEIDLVKAVANNDNDLYGIGFLDGDIYKKANFQLGNFTKLLDANTDGETWLFPYKNYLFYYDGSDLNYSGDITGTPTETTGYLTMTACRGSRDFPKPFIHPTDGYAYFFDRNKVYQLRAAPAAATFAADAGATEAAIDIPSNLSIQTACPFGEYIAIFAWDRDLDRSTLFIWDRSLTLEDFITIKEWSSGEVVYCADLGGNLFGITKSSDQLHRSMDIKYTSGTSGIINDLPSSSLVFDKRIIGDGFSVYDSQTDNNKLYFPGIETINVDETDPDAVTYFKASNIYELSADGSLRIAFSKSADTGSIQHFVKEGDVIMYVNDSGFAYVSVASDLDDLENNYTDKGQYIVMFDGGQGFMEKKFRYIHVWHSPILTGGSLEIEIFSEELGVWTSIKTNSTAGATRTSVENLPHVSQEFFVRVTVDKVEYLYGLQAETSHVKSNAS